MKTASARPYYSKGDYRPQHLQGGGELPHNFIGIHFLFHLPKILWPRKKGQFYGAAKGGRQPEGSGTLPLSKLLLGN